MSGVPIDGGEASGVPAYYDDRPLHEVWAGDFALDHGPDGTSISSTVRIALQSAADPASAGPSVTLCFAYPSPDVSLSEAEAGSVRFALALLRRLARETPETLLAARPAQATGASGAANDPA